MVMTKPVYDNRVGNKGFPLLHSLLYSSGEDDAVGAYVRKNGINSPRRPQETPCCDYGDFYVCGGYPERDGGRMDERRKSSCLI